MKLLHLKTAVVMFAAVALLAAAALAEDKQSATNVDDLLIAAQKICPVSGNALDSMGAPIKTKTGEQTIFLCCKGCVGKPISKENWKKVTANLIAAQGECPVKHQALPDDAPSIVVEHRMIFTCCKSCLTKITADPDKYIAVVNDLLKEHLKK